MKSYKTYWNQILANPRFAWSCFEQLWAGLFESRLTLTQG